MSETRWTPRRWLLLALTLGLVARFLGWLVETGVHHPDEIFQYLEPAHFQLYGHGWLSWEFEAGARNWLLPWHHGAVMRLLGWLGLEGLDLLRGLRLHNALFALAVVPAAWRLGVAVRGDRLGALTAIGVAALPTLALFAPHTLSETHALVLCTWAYALWLEQVVEPQRHGPRRAFVVGLLLGGVLITRVSLGIVLPLVFADYLLRRRYAELRAALGGLALALAILGLVDWLTWGQPFHSVAAYLQFNLIKGGAFGLEVQPFTFYIERFFADRLLIAGALLLIAPAFVGPRSRARVLLVLAWLIPLLALSALGLKKERFLLVIWPFLLCAGLEGWLQIAKRRALAWLPAAALALVLALNLGGSLSFPSDRYAGHLKAQAWVGQQPEATGLLVEGRFHLTGGHLTTARFIPQLPFEPLEDATLLDHRLYTHVIVSSEEAIGLMRTHPSFEEVGGFEGDPLVVLFARPSALAGGD